MHDDPMLRDEMRPPIEDDEPAEAPQPRTPYLPPFQSLGDLARRKKD
jgi:hypothetical protein